MDVTGWWGLYCEGADLVTAVDFVELAFGGRGGLGLRV